MSRVSVLSALALTALLLATPMLAADDAATLYKGSGRLSFEPQVTAAGATVTVTGPGGFYSQEEFASAANAAFEISTNMADGAYTYRLVLHPRVGAATRRAMDQARATGDDFTAEVLAAELAIDPISGSFTVRNGAIVNEALVESAAAISQTDSGFEATSDAATFNNVNAAAQVFATDVIVQGSECVGFDCVASESFGFDTLRLKENNLRIHFDDTSSSASFPSNDWRIVANDSSNGGANYLAFEDATAGRTPFKVEAGAIANALYVDSDGDVGVGTANPVVEVHSVDGNTPTLRLEQDGSNGFTPQTWDIAGNETNFFVRDVTNGSKLPFRIEPGAPDNSLYIDSTGNIGLGVTNPGNELVISANDRPAIQLIDTTETEKWEIKRSGSGLAFVNDTNGTNLVLFDSGIVRMGSSSTSGSEVFLLQANGDLAIAGALSQGSDRNSKQNIVPVTREEILEKVMQLPIARWEYKLRPDVEHVGPMAQDFHALFGLGPSDRRISTLDTSGVALAAVQALHQKLEEKQLEIDTLSQRLEALEARLAQ